MSERLIGDAQRRDIITLAAGIIGTVRAKDPAQGAAMKRAKKLRRMTQREALQAIERNTRGFYWLSRDGLTHAFAASALHLPLTDEERELLESVERSRLERIERATHERTEYKGERK